MADERVQPGRWSLKDLFPGPEAPELEAARGELEGLLNEFERWRETLQPNLEAAEFVRIIEEYERAVRKIARYVNYGALLFYGDTQDQKSQSLFAQGRQTAAEFENQTLFFKLWWKGLDDEPAQRLLEAAGDYRYWLEALRLQKPYTLSEPEEKVINLKDVNGHQAFVALYETITSRYSFSLELNGETKQLTEEELFVHVRGPDPDLRRAAYQELHRVYGQDTPILGQIYQNIVRDWRSEQLDLRGFRSPIAVRNLANHVPDEVVDTLLQVCRENVSLFHRFFELKAKWIGVERLRRYDLYAPVVTTDRSYEYHEAVEIVLDSFARFDPKIARLARRMYDENHVDSEQRVGKRSGAFCLTVEPALTPWVLHSYNGKPEDIATIAHELGHAIHSMLAEHHSALTQDSSLPLAETASTFGEMLVVDRLLATDPDPELQRDLLFRQMDMAYATITRQAYFTLFEREAHERTRQGASVDDLTELYFQNLKEQFGDSLELNEDFRHEWVRISYVFGSPFYSYAYSFGQLLVLALYRQYQEQGDSFKPRYLDILAAGGSDAPARVLDRAGIDVRSADFWQGGFQVLEEGLARLASLEVPARVA